MLGTDGNQYLGRLLYVMIFVVMVGVSNKIFAEEERSMIRFDRVHEYLVISSEEDSKFFYVHARFLCTPAMLVDKPDCKTKTATVKHKRVEGIITGEQSACETPSEARGTRIAGFFDIKSFKDGYYHKVHKAYKFSEKDQAFIEIDHKNVKCRPV